MTPLAIRSTIVTAAVMFSLLLTGVPLAWTLILSGLTGFAILGGLEKATALLGYTAWSSATIDTLVCVPLFIIMGRLASESGLTNKLFELASSFVGRLKGGLAMAVVIWCTIFGAVSGSTVAAISALAPVAIPEMTKNIIVKFYRLQSWQAQEL